MTESSLDNLVESGMIASYSYETIEKGDTIDEKLILVFPNGHKLFINSISTEFDTDIGYNTGMWISSEDDWDQDEDEE